MELTGPLRQDSLARSEKMYRVPQTGPRWPAVAGPVERGVRQHCFVVGLAQKRVVRELKTGLRDGGRLVELIHLLRDVVEGATVERRATA